MTPWELLPTGLVDAPNVYSTTSSPVDFSLFSYMEIPPFIQLPFSGTWEETEECITPIVQMGKERHREISPYLG